MFIFTLKKKNATIIHTEILTDVVRILDDFFPLCFAVSSALSKYYRIQDKITSQTHNHIDRTFSIVA